MITSVKSECWIIALFIRDDGERFVLGDGYYDFKEGQQHFAANSIDNTIINVQGGDGVYLAGQVKRATSQSFEGYVGDATTPKIDIEYYRRQFLAFFRTGFYYEVVYVFPNGTAVKRQRGFLTDAPAVEEFWQIHPEYHVALNFEDPNYYSYGENDEGEETYGQSAKIKLYNAVTGGFPYDKKGLIWDSRGAICNPRLGGTTTLNIQSINTVFPVWTVEGLADNPKLENLTTSSAIQYHGRVAIGQTLVIDMLNQTAMLNGVNVLQNISGEWFSFIRGINQVNYITDNNNATDSRVEWQEVVF